MDEMNAKRFRILIQKRLIELGEENVLGRGGQAVVELDQQSVRRHSRMDALQNQAMAKATQARRNGEMQRLAAALARLEEGEFGFCDMCGDEIALKRLELNPAAVRCISCA